MDQSQVRAQATQLALQVAKGCTTQYASTWTLSIYDTAWVSMVQDKAKRWLFPESFRVVLDEQKPGAGWAGHASDIDGILDTMASLLAIEKHLEASQHLPEDQKKDLLRRKEYAAQYLQDVLQQWEVETCMHVGFEIIVPALLSMLEKHETKFTFPGKEALLKMNFSKLSKFNAEMLYGPVQTTALHSLEAFIGKIDYDKLRHHTTYGSMMGSPSSTAAYLMEISGWDAESEEYLRTCIKFNGREGDGGVPSAFPCQWFEFSWVLTTLIEAGLPYTTFQSEEVSKALYLVVEELKTREGKIGFGPGMLPDADDTAKIILLLNCLGRSTSSASLVTHFLSPKGHILTYQNERNLSPSANCNALMCLLNDNPEENLSVIESVTQALCDCWYDGQILDKWNTSPSYVHMLLSQSFTKLLEVWNQGLLPKVDRSLVENRVVVVISQILSRILLDARDNTEILTKDETSSEEDSYKILACAALRKLPLPTLISARLDAVLSAARHQLSQQNELKDQYLWIEKITYGCDNLSQGYRIAALFTSEAQISWNSEVRTLFYTAPLHTVLRSVNSFTFLGEPEWKLETCLLESAPFTRLLYESRSKIFPLRNGVKNSYISYLPTAWIVTNNSFKLGVETTILWEMIQFSMWDFLVDEYMEATVSGLGAADQASVKAWIESRLDPTQDPSHTMNYGSPNELIAKSQAVHDVIDVLGRYADSILQHPLVKEASPYDITKLKTDIRDFLLAHLIQLQDSALLLRDLEPQTTENRSIVCHYPSSFYAWARTTASQHISCPVSFSFFSCLLATSTPTGKRTDCFVTPVQKYKASDFCAHLAVMSRLFNDYASVQRDLAERNLNSVNFPEFGGEVKAGLGSDLALQALYPLRHSLLHLGEYERQASRRTLTMLLADLFQTKSRQGEHVQGGCGEVVSMDVAELVKTLKGRESVICRGLQLFSLVTELFADLYVAKDLTNPVRT